MVVRCLMRTRLEILKKGLLSSLIIRKRIGIDITFQSVLISSNSKEEILFLFVCLNSPLNFLLLEKLLKNENEKNYLLAIKSVKQYVRIPKITSENQSIKDKVINLAGQMLGMEKQALGDLLELDTFVQTFDDVQVKGSELVLKTGSKEIRTKIR